MFRSARIKLTGWYLLMLLLVSGFFSMVIYKAVINELEWGFHHVQMRMRAEELGLPLPPGRQRRFFLKEAERGDWAEGVTEDFLDVKEGVAHVLLLTNGLILVLGAGASWFLAGRTLRPIEKVMKEQKRFVGDASHELRTPLTALKTSLEVALRDKKLTKVEAVKVIKSGLEDVEGLDRLSDRLLRLARFDSGGLKIEKEFDLGKVVKEVVAGLERVAKQNGVKLSGEYGRVKVSGDRMGIEDLVRILVDNGIKYTKKGGWVKVVVKQSKGKAIIKVSDNGVGIANEDQEKIFDRFYRVDSARTRKGLNGYGLGLSLAKQIVDEHGGKIWVESVKGQGSVFVVELEGLKKG